MICQKCKKDFPESELQESHDVPTYLFEGKRNERKQEADKYPRHWLCKKCHDEYEITILRILFLNLYKQELPLGDLELMPNMKKIYRACLMQGKRDYLIKICKKVSEEYINE